MLKYRNNKKRCMKKLLVVLAILFIGILLAGCTSQPAAPVATPTPTAVPTAVPTTIPTPVPTTETVIVVVNQTPNATPTATPTPQPSTTITFNADMTITPGTTVYIPVGGKVVFVNADPYKPHGIVATNVQSSKYFGGMSTITIPYGTPLSITFDKAGAYDYKTVFQQEMDGKIIVTK
jgi:plastocyanin